MVTGPRGRLAHSWVEKDGNSPCVLPFMRVGTGMPLAVTPEWRWMAIKGLPPHCGPRLPCPLLLAPCLPCPRTLSTTAGDVCFLSVPKAVEMFVTKMWAFLCPGNSVASKERELVESQQGCVFPEPMSEVLVGLGGGTTCAGFFAGTGVWLVSDRVWKPSQEYHSQEGPWKPHFHF